MFKPDDLRLAISTVARTPEYVHTTLASLFASDPLVHRLAGIHLVVDGVDASYLDAYRHHSVIRLHPLAEAEIASTSWCPHRRFCHNYYRCLSLDLVGAKGICICEDDIVFRDGFVSKLLRTIGEMEDANGIAKYILSCYVPYCLQDEPGSAKCRCYASYNASAFYGTQCVYYPRTVLAEVATSIFHDGVQVYKQPGDFIVRDYAKSIEALYGTIVSLTQHIGRVSTGIGYFHTAPTFNEPFPES